MLNRLDSLSVALYFDWGICLELDEEELAINQSSLNQWTAHMV